MDSGSEIFKDLIASQRIKEIGEKIIKNFEVKSGVAGLTGQSEESLIRECLDEVNTSTEDLTEVVEYLAQNWPGQGDIVKIIFNT